MKSIASRIFSITILVVLGTLLGAFIGGLGGILATEYLSIMVQDKTGIDVACFWGFGIITGFGLGIVGGFLYTLIFAPMFTKIPALIHLAMCLILGAAVGYTLPRFYQPECIVMLGQSESAWVTAKTGAICAVCYSITIQLASKFGSKMKMTRE